jgi:hypothetical protein
MNLAACRVLIRAPETGVWYRAVRTKHWQTALQTEQSARHPSRYNEGPTAIRPFEVLYLAEDHEVALFEVEALLGSPFADGNGTLLPNPRHSWLILNVRIRLQQVASLARVSQQALIATTAQELTGDWRGYQRRQPHDSVPEPTGTAPTQELGQALFGVRGLEGFHTLSARRPSRMILVVFPEKLLSGSEIIFSDDGGNTHSIKPRTRRKRRRSP